MTSPSTKKTAPRTGSIKDKIVAPDLLEERAKSNFNMQDMTIAIQGGPAEYARF